MHKIANTTWIGVDGELCASTQKTLDITASELGNIRPDGSRIAMALPMDSVFFEKIEFPQVSWRTAEKLILGQLDLKLPVPVEKCHVYSLPIKTSKIPVFLVFAIQKDNLSSRLAAFKKKNGCDPEAIFPIAAVLWLEEAKEVRSAIFFHGSEDNWTLLAIENGILTSAISVPTGDVQGVIRNVKILATRFKTPVKRFLLSGVDATSDLLNELNRKENALPCHAQTIESAENCLAIGLARAGTKSSGFRTDEIEHPAVFRRNFATCLCISIIPLLLSTGLLLSAIDIYHRSSRSLSQIESRIYKDACTVANMQLPQKGRAAAERAKTLFDWRNPTVEAFTEDSTLLALDPLFKIAATQTKSCFSIFSISFHDFILTVSGHVARESDISLWHNEVEKLGFKFNSSITSANNGFDFTATVSPVSKDLSK